MDQKEIGDHQAGLPGSRHPAAEARRQRLRLLSQESQSNEFLIVKRQRRTEFALMQNSVSDISLQDAAFTSSMAIWLFAECWQRIPA
jgi:hypothetical protein